MVDGRRKRRTLMKGKWREKGGNKEGKKEGKRERKEGERTKEVKDGRNRWNRSKEK